MRAWGGVTAAAAFAMVACSPPGTDALTTSEQAVTERLGMIQAAVTDWSDATTLADARAAAERARNLVVGPDNELYGDGDGDGVMGGEAERGLLPGQTEEPGIAAAADSHECAVADVLGGSWEDPASRWDEALAVYDVWTPGNNTMPRLASHPQRIVGWATLALAADDLDKAHDYAGHAQIHVDVSVRAISDCG